VVEAGRAIRHDGFGRGTPFRTCRW
jgi:hypothetical protein